MLPIADLYYLGQLDTTSSLLPYDSLGPGNLLHYELLTSQKIIKDDYGHIYIQKTKIKY